MENIREVFDAIQGDWRQENDEAFFTIESDSVKVDNRDIGKLTIDQRGSEFYSTSPLWDNCKIFIINEDNFGISYFPMIIGTKENISQSAQLAIINFLRVTK